MEFGTLIHCCLVLQEAMREVERQRERERQDMERAARQVHHPFLPHDHKRNACTHKRKRMHAQKDADAHARAFTLAQVFLPNLCMCSKTETLAVVNKNAAPQSLRRDMRARESKSAAPQSLRDVHACMRGQKCCTAVLVQKCACTKRHATASTNARQCSADVNRPCLTQSFLASSISHGTCTNWYCTINISHALSPRFPAHTEGHTDSVGSPQHRFIARTYFLRNCIHARRLLTRRGGFSVIARFS